MSEQDEHKITDTPAPAARHARASLADLLAFLGVLVLAGGLTCLARPHRPAFRAAGARRGRRAGGLLRERLATAAPGRTAPLAQRPGHLPRPPRSAGARLGRGRPGASGDRAAGRAERPAAEAGRHARGEQGHRARWPRRATTTPGASGVGPERARGSAGAADVPSEQVAGGAVQVAAAAIVPRRSDKPRGCRVGRPCDVWSRGPSAQPELHKRGPDGADTVVDRNRVARVAGAEDTRRGEH